jgi:exopolyphosphatase/pppGpp-phosphohydrolase
MSYIEKNKERLDAFIKKYEGKALTAVFDIGTKAGRILIAPKESPSKGDWVAESFYNDGQPFFLGKEVDTFFRTIDIENSTAFLNIIIFIKSYKEYLISKGVEEGDIIAVGTAVFRWLVNREEVVQKIKEETGVRLMIIDEEKESLISMYSIVYTYNFSASEQIAPRKFESEDVILLIDQGGGSTEVSYFFPKDVNKFGVSSIDECGTVALQKLFYTINSDDLEQRTDPALNFSAIPRQFERIEHFVDKAIDRWEGYPELAQKNIIAYAMGSAFSGSLPRPPWSESNPKRKSNNFTQHNMGLSKARLVEIIEDFSDRFDSNIEEVCDLYNLLEKNDNSITRKMENELTVGYGLPVYLKLMEKFNLRDISFAGFGLRYGVYIYQHIFKGLLDELEIKNLKVDEEEGEAIAWEQIRKYNTATAYEAYLNKYPEGAYAFIAQINLDKAKK